jgi:hypothetical protein
VVCGCGGVGVVGVRATRGSSAEGLDRGLGHVEAPSLLVFYMQKKVLRYMEKCFFG